MGNGAGQGVIYQIQAITNPVGNHPPVLAPIGDQTVNEGTKLTCPGHRDRPRPRSDDHLQSGGGRPSGASIGSQSGVFNWTPDPYSGIGDLFDHGRRDRQRLAAAERFEAFTVNVLPVNHPPNLLSIPAQLVERGRRSRSRSETLSPTPTCRPDSSYSLAPAPLGREHRPARASSPGLRPQTSRSTFIRSAWWSPTAARRR